MMLRSRNNNTNNISNGANDLLNKRGKKQVADDKPSKGEPKAKRAALTDLSKAISNVLIDSSKKSTIVEKKVVSRGTRRSQNSGSEPLEVIDEKQRMTSNSASKSFLLWKFRDNSVIEVPVEATEADPCPGYDFDKESSSDPYSVHLFANDIFKYYKSREEVFAVRDYIHKFPKIDRSIRAIVVDWMVELQETFELNHETLYLAVKLVDMFLDRTTKVYGKESVQLIASSAIFIASKFDERSPPLIDDFLYLNEDSFTRDNLIHMEMQMLDTVGYDLGSPLSYRFLRRYARVTKADMATLTLARYILETSLMFFDFSLVSESRLAGAGFLLALKMKNKDAKWDAVLLKYSGYHEHDVLPLMWELNHMLHIRPTLYSKLENVFSKYSHEIFHCSAAVPLLADIYPKDRPIQVV